jgi:hypothetical protein
MYEPLRGKKRRYNPLPTYFFFESDVKSAVEFYKKYRYGSGHSLREEHPEIYELYNKYRKSVGIVSSAIDDHWLFDYCFGDVIT